MSPTTDENLESVLIGGLEERPIVIVEHDSQWALRFEALAVVIRKATGEGSLLVEHIGSTAVPGLAAKPIIDILMTVVDVLDEAS